LFNFGSPRLGNKAFTDFAKKLVGEKTYRVVHYRDIVPHLPFVWLGFHHISQEVWYTDEMSTNYKVCDDTGEDFSCMDSVVYLDPGDHTTYLNLSSGCWLHKIIKS